MAKRKKTQPQRKSSQLGKLMQDLQTELPGSKIILRPAGESKISDVFWKFIEPFKEYATTDEAMDKLVTLGIIAWNAEVIAPDGRQKFLDTAMRDVLAVTGADWRSQVKHILDSLSERKRKMFAADTRYIVSYRLNSTATQYHLSMVSTLLSDKPGS
jgi:hypothetical protein